MCGSVMWSTEVLRCCRAWCVVCGAQRCVFDGYAASKSVLTTVRGGTMWSKGGSSGGSSWKGTWREVELQDRVKFLKRKVCRVARQNAITSWQR